MEKEKTKVTSILAVTLFVSVSIFIFLFVNSQQDKYNYFLYIYGTEVSPGSKALVKVISRDGEFVPNPQISVNGRRSQTALINLRPDLKEISVVIGGDEIKFPVRYSDLEMKRFSAPEQIHISQKELENVTTPAFAGTRTVFLLPDQFRVVSEFETKVHLFCIEGKSPCQEKEITINGSAKTLKEGYLSFTTVFTQERNVNISFSDGSSAVAKMPYSGKMFRFYDSSQGMVLASLSDVKNVHIDCYSADRWIGTDIVSVDHTGTKLPEGYMNCETVQASFNSSSPGTTFVVFSRSLQLRGEIDDPYYYGLAGILEKFSPEAQYSFIKSYNASFFKTLPLIFSGDVLENDFNEKKSGELNFYWWMISVLSFAGLILFVVTVTGKMRVVEGIDGELISRSMNNQRFILAGAVAFYVLFVTLLLYLLKNLA